MPNKPNSQQLAAENRDLRARLEKAETTLSEILSGEAEALFVTGVGGAQLFSLKGADQSYRTLIENMSEGALTLTPEGLILYANRRFAEMLGTPLEKVIGSEIHTWIAPESRQILQELLRKDAVDNRRVELALADADGTQVPVYLSASRLVLDGLPESFCMVATDLTEQKRNAAMLAAEKLSNAILEQAADAIVICDENGRIIRASKQAQELYGTSPIGQQFERAYPLHQPDGTAFSTLSTTDTNRSVSVESRLERNGQEFDLLVSVGHLKGARHELLGSVVTLADITEQKQTSEALRSSLEEFRTLAEAMPQIVWITRADGWNIYFNQNWMDYTGLTLEESLGHGWNKPFHPDDRQLAWDAWQKATSTNGIYSIESRLRRADGVYRWWLVRGVPLLGNDGNILKWFGTCTDIHDLKMAGLEIASTNQMLSESDARYRGIFEYAHDIIYLLEPDGTFRSLNKSFARITGWAADEWIGKTFASIIHPDDLPYAYDIFRSALAGKAVSSFRLRVGKKSGEYFDADLSITPLGGKVITGVLGIARDITDRKLAETTRQLHAVELEESQRIARIGSWAWEIATGVITWSDGMNDVLARDRALPAPDFETMQQFYMPQSWQLLGAAIANTIETGAPYDIELEMIRADGTTCWATTRGEAVRGTDGTVVKLRGTVHDITERKQADDEIQLKNIILKTQQETSPDAILVVDENARIISYNQKFIGMWGLSPQIVSSGMDVAVLQSVAEQVENLKTFVARVEYLYAHRDDKSHEEIPLKYGRIIDRYSAPMTGAGGRYYGRVWYFRDITERKHMEESLKNMAARYHTMFEKSADAIILFNDKGFFDCNEATLRMFGCPARDDFIGKHPAEFSPPTQPGGEDSMSLANQHIAAAIKNGSYLFEWRHRRFDGTGFPAEVLLTVMELDGKAVLQAVVRDITERKTAEARITHLNRVLLVLSSINTLIVRVNDRGELFSEACNIAVDAGGFRMAMLVIVDPVTKLPVSITSAGKNEELLAEIKEVLSSGEGMQNSLVGKAIRENKAAISNDTQNDPQLSHGKQYSEAGVKSLAVLPLLISGNAFGALALYASEINFFRKDEMKLLTELAGDIAYAVDHINKQERLNYLAYYDVLTGLANRTLFLERAAQYMRSADSGGHKLAIGLIDLERFKNINDSLGRPAGDALLKQVAEWLTQFTRDAGLLARIDADHFAFVVPEVKSDGNLITLFDNIAQAFQAHLFRVNGSALRLAAKTGIAIFPDDGTDAETVYGNAEAALKAAKKGGDRYLFHARKMTEAVTARLTLENQLRQAIDNEEFVLHYQPKVNLLSGKVTSAEALIRWNDPRTGLVPPGKFIPILEETGLISEVGRWALRQAVTDYLRWRDADLPAVRIAVNVSPLQLRNLNFIDEIRQGISLDEHAAAGLELEITESLIMENVEQNIATLQAIRALGVTIAIDDFGTGFSSLSYLAKLPVDTLKIDRAFVIEMDRPEGMALVSTVIIMAHALKLKVVAEGVETEQQSRQLLSLNCDEMQGFLFSKPVPAEIFEARFLTPLKQGDK